MLEKRWWVAAEIAFEDTRVEDDPLSVQVDQVPRDSSRRNSLGLEPNFDTSRPGIRHSYNWVGVWAEQLTGERHQ